MPLRALLIEDSEDDALLIVREMERAGYLPQVRRVETADGVHAALDAETWDIVISDFNMPQFSGTDALKLLRSRDEDTPFIFVSGTIGEDVAVDAMRAGAQDYVIKGNLRRLIPAIERELREARVRRARRVSEARFRRVVESGMMGICFWNADGRITEANDEFLRVVGYSRADLADGLLDEGALTTSGHDDVDAHARREQAERGTCTPYEKAYLRKDGIPVPVLIGRALLAGEETTVAFVLDMTERRRAADAIRARERQQEAVAILGRRSAETRDLAVLCDLAATLVADTLDVEFTAIFEQFAHDRTLRLRCGSGWHRPIADEYSVANDAASPHGRTFAVGDPVIVEDLRTDERCRDAVLLQAHDVTSGVTVLIPGHQRAFGVLGAYTSKLRTFTQDDIHFLEAVAHILGTLIDRDRADSALRQSQRLESVGQLAGGIAHDFNNLLTVMSYHSEYLMGELRTDDPRHESASEISNATSRAASLTRQLLAFSRRQMLEPKIINLNDVVGNLEKMLGRLIGEHITLRSVLQPDLRTVKADPGQLEQVIVNLAVNARDAMPAGGTLTLATRNVELDASSTDAPDGSESGSYVMLEVVDTGEGMDRETQSRIFDPFFTTKPADKGTGLGLATVHGVVKQSGGGIHVESAPGAGTTFRIFLPVCADGDEAGPATPRSPERDGGGAETILLVEDEDAVRRTVERVLRNAGYDVLVAVDGEHALRLGNAHVGSIHLLVSDVRLPGISGDEVARRLVDIRPAMRVLLISGYTDPGIVRGDATGSPFAFLHKPFSIATLTRKVRQILDGVDQPANGKAPVDQG